MRTCESHVKADVRRRRLGRTRCWAAIYTYHPQAPYGRLQMVAGPATISRERIAFHGLGVELLASHHGIAQFLQRSDRSATTLNLRVEGLIPSRLTTHHKGLSPFCPNMDRGSGLRG